MRRPRHVPLCKMWMWATQACVYPSSLFTCLVRLPVLGVLCEAMLISMHADTPMHTPMHAHTNKHMHAPTHTLFPLVGAHMRTYTEKGLASTLLQVAGAAAPPSAPSLAQGHTQPAPPHFHTSMDTRSVDPGLAGLPSVSTTVAGMVSSATWYGRRRRGRTHTHTHTELESDITCLWS